MILILTADCHQFDIAAGSPSFVDSCSKAVLDGNSLLGAFVAAYCNCSDVLVDMEMHKGQLDSDVVQYLDCLFVDSVPVLDMSDVACWGDLVLELVQLHCSLYFQIEINCFLLRPDFFVDYLSVVFVAFVVNQNFAGFQLY